MGSHGDTKGSPAGSTSSGDSWVQLEPQDEGWTVVPVPQVHEAALRHGVDIHCLMLLAWVLSLIRLDDEKRDVSLHWQPREGTARRSTLLKLSKSSPPLAEAVVAIKTARAASVEGDVHTDDGLICYNDHEMDWSLGMEMKMSDDGDQLWLRPLWRGHDATIFMANLLAHCTAHIFSSILSSDGNVSTDDVLGLGDYEKEQLWRWNQHVPPSIRKCMHELIAEQAQTCPDSPAVCAWDGDFTHGDVERMSTTLARHLVSVGLRVGQVVPLCFDKSRWTVVAVLAVLKAGGSILLMDPSQPKARLASLSEQVEATLLLTSRRHADFGLEISPNSQVVAVDQALFAELANRRSDDVHLPQVSPSSVLYIIFTSGSTGQPKGVIISHETYTSGALPRADAVGYDSTSRVLDFASYAFDVSIDSMLCTLLRGGCLCIPSDQDRVNDLSGAIRRFKVTMANLTPSVARVLDGDIVPSLHSLGLGGESVSANEVNTWGQYTRIVIGYGPSECTVGCTINSSAATGKNYTNLGYGVGGVMWIVDPDNHDRLMPIGAVGELLVEGPIVGQGYLNDPKKTAAAFIDDTTWLLSGSDNIQGRRGRLYKTGDLCRYDPDGSGRTVFVGRKDNQVKLRGQRVELGEIEHQLRSCLPQGVHVAAEVLNAAKPTLVAFIAQDTVDRDISAEAKTDLRVQKAVPSQDLVKAVETIESELRKVLPIYMVPSIYIHIDRMPILVSGKTDRKQLREFGSSAALQDLSLLKGDVSGVERPHTDMEIVLLNLWIHALGLPSENIGRRHNFFALGGDSVSAMKLVAAARDAEMSLTVADVFRNPVFKDMALAIQKIKVLNQNEIHPFSLLDPKSDLLATKLDAANSCGVEAQSVQDIYPCTPLQEVLMAFAARSQGGFVAQRIADISNMPNIERFRAAWDVAISDNPVLRTRVVQLPEHGLVQVVLDEETAWDTSRNLSDYLKRDKKSAMQLGSALARHAIVEDEVSGKRYFVWTVHHALYDAWATPCILERVKRAYEGLQTPSLAQMKHFVSYLNHAERGSSKEYWKLQLNGATGPQFPALPSRSYLPRADSEVEHYIPLKKEGRTSVTTATIIRAAWALVASQYTMSDDVVFGDTLNGRNVPIPGAEKIEGPMITTVPVRVRIDRRATIGQYLETVQNEAVRMMPHEHIGLQHIRKLSSDAQIACEIKTGFNIQPDQDEESADSKHGAFRFEATSDTDPAREALQFNSYPLLLVCSLRQQGFRVLAGFDSRLVSVTQMRRMLAQLEVACRQLTAEQDRRVQDVVCISDLDVRQIWDWNRTAPAVVDGETGRLLFDGSEGKQVGFEHPKPTVPWIVDPFDPQRLMPIGAVGELLFEGPLSSTDFVHDPAWLITGHEDQPGRHGHLHKTGDLVRYDADGRIIFAGRKDQQVRSDGHIIDLSMVEHHLRGALTPGATTAVTIVRPTADADHGVMDTTESILVVFIHEPVADDERTTRYHPGGIELPPDVATSLSADLAKALVGINNFLSNVLPPFMVPRAFVPLAERPSDRERVQQLADSLSVDTIRGFEHALTTLREEYISSVNLTDKERLLQRLWSEILGARTAKIAADDSFFGLGGDSIMAMKLVSAVRRASYSLSVADIFRNMRLDQMANAMKEGGATPRESRLFAPFSALHEVDAQAFTRDRVRPQLANPTWRIKDVLPVTDSQHRDIEATTNAPRSSVQYTLLYLSETVDAARLLECCDTLVAQHDILRTVFIQESDRYLQVVLEALPALSALVSFNDGVTNDTAHQFCAGDIETDFALGTPFAKFVLLAGNGKENCLVLRLSHAQYDGISLPELIRQLTVLYEGGTIPEAPEYSSYIYTSREAKEEGVRYWRDLLAKSHLSLLEGPEPCAEGPSTFITRDVDITGCEKDITMATLLTTAWAVVLSRATSTEDVTFGSVVTGRSIDISDVERIMGPCYQYMPIRIHLDSAWTNSELLHAVQLQAASSAPFSSLGFREIAKECTNWPREAEFFDSLVHHQDIEYFDTLPLGDGSCRVDVANPHPEPGRPWKIVSFPKDDRMRLGIVGYECERGFIDSKLDELAQVIRCFVEQPQAPVMEQA